MTLLSFMCALSSAVFFAITIISEDVKCKVAATTIGTVIFLGGLFTL